MLKIRSTSAQNLTAKLYARCGQRNTTTSTRTFILKAWQTNMGSLQRLLLLDRNMMVKVEHSPLHIHHVRFTIVHYTVSQK